MSKGLKRSATNIFILGLLLSCGVAANVFGVESTAKVTRMYLAGDSTVKTYGPALTTGGWGEYLQNYFNAKNAVVINKAEGGRSSRSFINQGRLKEIQAEIGAGDYLFIQFGHNDESTGPEYELERTVGLGTPGAEGIFPIIAGEPVDTPQKLLNLKTAYPYGPKYYPAHSGTYKWYLKHFIEVAREKGAIPVLVTPVSRRYFAGDKIVAHHGPNDAYVTAVVQLAREMKVEYIDLFAKTKAMYEKLGEKASEKYQNLKANGTLDNTHYSKYGAYMVAGLMAEAIREKGLGIARDVVVPTGAMAPSEERVKIK